MSYEDRMQTMGLAPKEVLQNLLRQTITFMSTALDAPPPATPTGTTSPPLPVVAVVLDVRSLDEIKATGSFHRVVVVPPPTPHPEAEPLEQDPQELEHPPAAAAAPAPAPRGRHEWIHIPVMPDMTEELVHLSSTLLPDKDLPIVVYCKSGNRARYAKLALEGQGYTHVLNAGGYDDIITLDLS